MAGTKPTHPPVFTRDEVRWLLKLSLATVDNMISRGELAAVKVGRRTFVTRGELQRVAPWLTDDILDAAFPQ